MGGGGRWPIYCRGVWICFVQLLQIVVPHYEHALKTTWGKLQLLLDTVAAGSDWTWSKSQLLQMKHEWSCNCSSIQMYLEASCGCLRCYLNLKQVRGDDCRTMNDYNPNLHEACAETTGNNFANMNLTHRKPNHFEDPWTITTLRLYMKIT